MACSHKLHLQCAPLFCSNPFSTLMSPPMAIPNPSRDPLLCWPPSPSPGALRYPLAVSTWRAHPLCQSSSSLPLEQHLHPWCPAAPWSL
nr:hypothetical protein [Zea mays]